MVESSFFSDPVLIQPKHHVSFIFNISSEAYSFHYLTVFIGLNSFDFSLELLEESHTDVPATSLTLYGLWSTQKLKYGFQNSRLIMLLFNQLFRWLRIQFKLRMLPLRVFALVISWIWTPFLWYFHCLIRHPSGLYSNIFSNETT